MNQHPTKLWPTGRLMRANSAGPGAGDCPAIARLLVRFAVVSLRGGLVSGSWSIPFRVSRFIH